MPNNASKSVKRKIKTPTQKTSSHTGWYISLILGIAIGAFYYQSPSQFHQLINQDTLTLLHNNLPDSLQSLVSPYLYQRQLPTVSKYSIHELFANNSMAWNISTTPVPISTPSVILKSILAKEYNKIPSELRHLADQDTVQIDTVRQYVNRQRYHTLVHELCAGDNRKECERYVNQPDPEFNFTPLHLASAACDDQSIAFLKSLGANADLLDNAGRKPQNLTFASFVKNSKKFARLAGRSDCDIPVVNVKSEKDFLEIRRLVNEGEPVLIKNILPFLKKGSDLANLELKQLIQLHGDSKVTVGEVPYADVFRLGHSIQTLKDYYEQHVLTKSSAPLYIFQKHANITDDGLKVLSDLVINAFPSPNLICPVEYGDVGSDSIHFYLGAKNSGAPFHIHADAINLVVNGGKRWFLYPPLQSLYSRKHISRWLKEDYEQMSADERPLECIQGPGDIVYIPFDWSHAVLNIEDQTFGYALELLNRREVMASLPALYQSC